MSRKGGPERKNREAERYPGSIADLVRGLIGRKFGLKGIIPFLVASLLFYTWLDWTAMRERPGIAEIVDWATREPIRKADPSRFSVAVARLENDANRENERLITSLLADFEGVQVITVDRTIPVGGPVPEQTEAKGHERARKYLKKSGASVMIWGSVLRLGSDSTIQLYMTTATEAPGRFKRYRPEAAKEFRLPEVFWSDLSQVLGLLVRSNASSFDARPGRPIAAELAPFIDRTRKLIASPQVQWDETARTSTRIILADALWRLSVETTDPAALEEAISLYEQSIPKVSRDAHPKWWAEIHRSAGGAYADLAWGRHGGTEFSQALSHLNSALQVYTKDGFPDEWAAMQHGLANLVLARAEKARPEESLAGVNQALVFFDRALEKLNETEHPQAWASAQNDRGTAFKARATRTGANKDAIRDLDLAAACYENALRVHTYDALPARWAATKVNLGISLLEAAELQRDEGRVKRAIAAFTDALRVYTRTTYGRAWGETKNSLGNAYAALGEWRQDPEMLRRADIIYRQAQEIRTRTAFPGYWAVTQTNRAEAVANLGRIKRDPGMLREAEATYEQALEVLRREGDANTAEYVTGKLRQLRAELRPV